MKFLTFPDRHLASVAAANWFEAELRGALSKTGKAGLLVSGGSSPGNCLSLLSNAKIDWHQVQVSLTDERMVAVTDPASNEKMVRETLLRHRASAAVFKQVGELDTAELTTALVGMGEDGHFASIFPDNSELVALTDPDAEPGCRDVVTSSSEHKRKTVNLSYLLQAKSILLLAFGEAKKNIIERHDGYPVAALLNQKRVPVVVYWAP